MQLCYSYDMENLKYLLVAYQIKSSMAPKANNITHGSSVLCSQCISYALPKLDYPTLWEHIVSFYSSVPLLMLFLLPGMLFPLVFVEKFYLSLYIWLKYDFFGKCVPDSTTENYFFPSSVPITYRPGSPLDYALLKGTSCCLEEFFQPNHP